MTRCLISFDDGAMTFPEEDLPDVADAWYRWSRTPRTPTPDVQSKTPDSRPPIDGTEVRRCASI